MRRVLFVVQLLIVALAAVVAAAPLPPALVERYYSDWFYPALQSRLTSWANDTAVALFDFILFALSATLLIMLWHAVRRAIRERSFVGLLYGLLRVATFVAVVFLWFQVVWGLNYARIPLESTITYERSRVTAAAVRALAERAAQEVNRGYAPAHAAGFPAIGDTPATLVTAFHDLERRLGRMRPTTPGRPKHTLLRVFFRASGTDGMHAPFLLETLVNPDLTPPERPAVLAHEWAHLAGFAPEDDASFVGTLAALRADAGARYSAWLSLTFETTSQLPRADRERVLAMLEDGPRQDRQAIIKRLESRIQVVQRVSWQTYDQYLKSQGVREGIQSYSRVVELLVASGAIDWQP